MARRAIETEWETAFVEVNEDVLADHGWGFFVRLDSDVFTVMIPQQADLDEALSTGRHLLAKHKMKTQDGRGFLGLGHMDHLRPGKLQDEDVMETVYDPGIGHPSIIVLKKIS